jgi:hypothetical protein
MSEVARPLAETLDDTVAPHVLEVLLGSVETADPTTDPTREKVLEVIQVFGDAVVDLKHFAPGRAVSLGATLVRSLRGTRHAEDFFLPTALLPAPSHALFAAEDGGWVAVVAPGWNGWVEGPAGRRTIAAFAALASPGADGLLRMPIGPDERAVVEIGTAVFVARPVRPSKRVAVAGRDGIDYPLLGITGFMGFVAMMFGVALSTVQPPAKASRLAEEDRLVEILLNRPVEAPKPPAPAPGPSGERAKDAEGSRGKRDATEAEERSPLARRERDRATTEAAGVLGALQNNATLDAMLGDAGLSSAISAGLGAIVGPRATQVGAGGLGQRSGGFGGGGDVASMGGLAPRGRGPGADGFRPGGGTKAEGAPTKLDTGELIALGQLDKALIDAVVKRNLAQVRYCYQRELTKNPTLQGKITVKFTIAGDGTVSSATTKASSMANAAVESCINGRFMRMTFPEPKGGGLVIVSYPFFFAPG